MIGLSHLRCTWRTYFAPHACICAFAADVVLGQCHSLAEGRQPWGAPGSGPPESSAQFGGGGGGVWSAAAGDSGQLVASGGDDGVVALWDVRAGTCVWQVRAVTPAAHRAPLWTSSWSFEVDRARQRRIGRGSPHASGHENNFPVLTYFNTPGRLAGCRDMSKDEAVVLSCCVSAC